MADDLSAEQQLAVIFETETAASLLGAGLRSLASRSVSNDELHCRFRFSRKALSGSSS